MQDDILVSLSEVKSQGQNDEKESHFAPVLLKFINLCIFIFKILNEWLCIGFLSANCRQDFLWFAEAAVAQNHEREE